MIILFYYLTKKDIKKIEKEHKKKIKALKKQYPDGMPMPVYKDWYGDKDVVRK